MLIVIVIDVNAAIFLRFILPAEFAIICLLEWEGRKMLKTWMKTIKEEIAAVQEEMGATRDLLVAREQGCLLVISAHY